MNRKHTRIPGLAAASSVALVLALAGCGDRGQDTASQPIVPAPQAESGSGTGTAPASSYGTAGQQPATSDQQQPIAGASGEPDAYHRNTTANNMVPERSPQTDTAGAGAGAAAATGEGSDRSDPQLTARVNAQLAQDEDLSALRIDVDTSEGQVTLEGQVPDAEAKQRAERLARGVDGVTNVNNQLEVSGS